MSIQPQIRRRLTGGVIWLAIVAGAWFWWSYLPPPPDPWMLNLAGNPDKFFLWGTMTHFDHTFTYDPHAADEWRVENFVVPASFIYLTRSTN